MRASPPQNLPASSPPATDSEPTESPDDEPIESLDDEPMEQLLERLRPRFKRVLAHYSIPVDDAEDILQDVLISAVRQWDAVHNREAWVITALRNRCALHWKRCWRRRMEGMDPQDLEALCEPLRPSQQWEELWWDVEAVAAALGPRHWALLCLRYGQGLTIEEMAERLGYCPTSIRKLVSRALTRLRRWLTAPPRLPSAPGS